MPLMLWKQEGRHSVSGGKSVNLTGKVPDWLTKWELGPIMSRERVYALIP
jgi:hypothetical protein